MEWKFRGKDIETNKWVYGSLIKAMNETFICVEGVEVGQICGDGGEGRLVPYEEMIEVIPESVGLWTGKNEDDMDTGKEIYSNDFVTLHQFLFDGNEVESTIFGLIKYDPDGFGFALERIKNSFYEDYTGYEPSEGSCPINCFYGLHDGSWKVVGNLTDTPDLLEAT